VDETTLVRQDLVERLDAMAQLLEDVATEAVREGQLGLATDLWVASARVLGASDELWNPASRLRESLQDE
jgi:hypothetical protein